MNKFSRRSLALHRDTLKLLNTAALQRVAGGTVISYGCQSGNRMEVEVCTSQSDNCPMAYTTPSDLGMYCCA